MRPVLVKRWRYYLPSAASPCDHSPCDHSPFSKTRITAIFFSYCWFYSKLHTTHIYVVLTTMRPSSTYGRPVTQCNPLPKGHACRQCKARKGQIFVKVLTCSVFVGTWLLTLFKNN